MNRSIADLFKSHLFHVDLKKHEVEVSSKPLDSGSGPAAQEFQRQPNSSGALNSIMEEERSLSGSNLSESASEDSTQTHISSKNGKLRNLKNRISSFPDLKFRLTSGTSSPGDTPSDSGSGSAPASAIETHQHPSKSKSPAFKIVPKNRSNNKSTSSSLSLTSLDKPPVINIEDGRVPIDRDTPKQNPMCSSEKRQSLSSITRINTASSNGSSVRSGLSTWKRKGLMRSNSDNDQVKSKPLSHSVLYPTSNELQEDYTGGNAAMERRRSRTVGASDYESVGVPLKLSLSKLRARSDSNSVEPSMGTNKEKASASPNLLTSPSVSSHLRQSSSSKQFGTSSRRSSSLVSAIGNFVTMRSASVSSRNSSPRLTINFDDLPKPPEPKLDETCDQYLKSICSYGKYIAVILTSDDDDFRNKCLFEFLKSEFDFSREPLDISLRKLLMFLELPKESQQIDRVLSEFSKVYYEQNKDECLWKDHEEVFFIAFSLLVLHTDAFNPNNKIKMTKQEFVKLMRYDTGSGASQTPKEILEYFYDNITAREFSKCDSLDLGGIDNTAAIDIDSAADPESDYSPKKLIRDGRLLASNGTGFAPVCKVESANNLSPYVSMGPSSSSTTSIAASSSRADSLDIYFRIASDTLKTATLESQVELPSKIEEAVSVSDSLNSQHSKYLSIIKETKGGYLRLPHSILDSLTDSHFEDLSSEDEESEFRYLKIVQMGDIQELVTNKKFSIVGNVNRLIWKRHFGILTTSCLLLFNSMDWVEPRIEVDKKTSVSNYIIDCPISIQITHKFGCNGLFAIDKLKLSGTDLVGSMVRDHSLSSRSMYVYNQNRKLTFACPNYQERQNWVDAINIAAAVDGCFIEIDAIPYTVVSPRRFTTVEKLEKLQNNWIQREEKFNRTKTLVKFVRRTLPLNNKIRSALVEYMSHLEKRLDWLHYESCRCVVFSQILQILSIDLEDMAYNSESDSSVEQSFFFSEGLERCRTDHSADQARDTSFSSAGILAEYK